MKQKQKRFWQFGQLRPFHNNDDKLYQFEDVMSKHEHYYLGDLSMIDAFVRLQLILALDPKPVKQITCCMVL